MLRPSRAVNSGRHEVLRFAGDVLRFTTAPDDGRRTDVVKQFDDDNAEPTGWWWQTINLVESTDIGL